MEQDNNISTDTVADQGSLAASDLQKSSVATVKHRTFGNKMFDALVWPIVQGVGVWWLSLKIGKEATDSTSKWTSWLRNFTSSFERITEKVIKGPVNTKIAQKIWGCDEKTWAKNITLYWVLSLGGTALIPVTHFFEKHRKEVANVIDNVYHEALHLCGFEAVARKPEEIQSEPKQTLLSMLSGRAFYMACTFPAFIALGPRRMEWCQTKIGGGITELYKTIRPEGNAKNFRKWADMAVFDMMLCVVSAAVTYFRSRFVARRNEAKLHASEVMPTDMPPSSEDIISPSWVNKKPQEVQIIKAKSHVDAVQKSRSGEFAIGVP